MKTHKETQKNGIPKRKWIPTELWNQILSKLPIPCLDLIVQRPNNSILYGWRLIPPYRNKWALIGGRILHGEDLRGCASRIATEYGLTFGRLYLNGVFPINFSTRADLVISLAAIDISGEPRVDGFEFSKFVWSRRPPLGIGTNYHRMVMKWNQAKKSATFLRLNRIV